MTPAPLLLLLMLCLATGLLPPAAMAQPQAVGRIEQAAGMAWAIPQGATERTLGRGDSIFEGESIVTACDGERLIRMVDDAAIAVRANTRFTVNRYPFAGRERVAAAAQGLGLLNNVPAVFRPGLYDNLLQAAAELVQQQLLKQLPGNLRQFVPNLPGLLR